MLNEKVCEFLRRQSRVKIQCKFFSSFLAVAASLSFMFGELRCCSFPERILKTVFRMVTIMISWLPIQKSNTYAYEEIRACFSSTSLRKVTLILVITHGGLNPRKPRITLATCFSVEGRCDQMHR